MPKVVSSKLLKPQGDLDSEVILTGVSSPDVKVQVDMWISEAYARLLASGVSETDTKAPEAVTAYVAYKAYYNKYINMLASPIHTWVEGEARDQYDVSQIREFKRIAENYLNEYVGIVSGILQLTQSTNLSSSHMSNEFTF